MIRKPPFSVMRVVTCSLPIVLALSVALCINYSKPAPPSPVAPGPLPVDVARSPSAPFVPPKPVVWLDQSYPDYTQTCVLTPVKVAGNVRSVAAGDTFVAYVTNADELYVLGVGEQDRDFIYGSHEKDYAPVLIATNVRSVAMGDSHCLCISNDGTLYGIGSNVFFQLGQKKHDLFSEPVEIARHVARVAARGFVSLFITEDGTLYGMGLSQCGQLGIAPNDRSVITCTHGIVKLAEGVADCAVGEKHVLFLKTNGDLFGMGANDESQLSLFSSAMVYPVQRWFDPYYPYGRSVHSMISMNLDMRLSNGNPYGVIINGAQTIEAHPVLIAQGIARMAAGGDFSALLTRTGHLYWFGSDLSFWQYLEEPRSSRRKTPHRVATGVGDIAAGARSLFYTTGDGSLYSMGWNGAGELGNGTYDILERPNPSREPAKPRKPSRIATDVTSMAAGHSCAYFITSDGTLYGMGSACFGQLGAEYSSFAERPAPPAEAK